MSYDRRRDHHERRESRRDDRGRRTTSPRDQLAHDGDHRRYDDYEDEALYVDAMSPDAFTDRLGEPDEWKNEGTGDDLQMTAIWYCVDGQHRTAKWVITTRERGGDAWQLVQDESRDCDEERNPAGSDS